jgi:hypothetical protein
MTDKLENTWKNAIVAFLKVLSQHSPRRIEKPQAVRITRVRLEIRIDRIYPSPRPDYYQVSIATTSAEPPSILLCRHSTLLEFPRILGHISRKHCHFSCIFP